MASYQDIARESRIKVLDLIHKAQSSHIGSNFSCADIMAVLFEKIDLDKDRFVLSAGWKAAMLYYHLWRKGRITEEELNSYCQEGSKFIGLAEPIHPDIPLAGGSMGLGLPGAVGLALAKKLKGEDGKVYVLMSDGEIQIGTTWESLLIARHHNLNNLVVIVDVNGFQAMGKTSDVLDITHQLYSNSGAFAPHGYHRPYCDGHDYESIEKSLDHVFGVDENGKPIKPYPEFKQDILDTWEKLNNWPKFIFAHTIKGKGVSFMENNNLYHYKMLSDEELERAMVELGETGVQQFERTGRTYAPTPDDVCLECGEKIGNEEFTTVFKSEWDGKEKFDFNRHVTDELRGYKHFRCAK